MDSNIINAISKNHQSEEMLRRMTRNALGSFSSFNARELGGGLCNAVYLIEVDGEKYVMKIAPEKTVTMMRHEKDVIKTEANMLKLFGDKLNVPSPKLIFADNKGEVCGAPYFLMSYVEGQPLNTLNPYPSEGEVSEIKRRVGRICRDISSLKADKFGIPALKETWFDNNCDFMKKLFEMLFEDAADKKITVPGIEPNELLDFLESLRFELNEAEGPCCTHTDTWDGNIMIKDGKLVSLIDYEAILFGDPLINHDFHDFSPTPGSAFLEGYGKNGFSDNELIRIQVYKVWQRLGMIIERAFRGYDNPDLYSWVIGEYEKELEKLIKI